MAHAANAEKTGAVNTHTVSTERGKLRKLASLQQRERGRKGGRGEGERSEGAPMIECFRQGDSRNWCRQQCRRPLIQTHECSKCRNNLHSVLDTLVNTRVHDSTQLVRVHYTCTRLSSPFTVSLMATTGSVGHFVAHYDIESLPNTNVAPKTPGSWSFLFTSPSKPPRVQLMVAGGSVFPSLPTPFPLLMFCSMWQLGSVLVFPMDGELTNGRGTLCEPTCQFP